MSRDNELESLEISLKSTTAIIQDLLNEVRNNATYLAVLKEKIESLESTTNELSHILRGHNGNDSITIRLAFAEKYVEDIKTSIVLIQSTLLKLQGDATDNKKSKEEQKESFKQFRRDKLLARYGIWAAVVSGLVSLAVVIFQTFIK